MLPIVMRGALSPSICFALSIGLAAASTAAAREARADVPAPPAPPGEPPAPSDPKAAAQQHFVRAKELYQSGSYKEARAELEAARALDPQAKDLVFNLGIVDERLGRLDDALKAFRLYVDMPDVTPAERQRAETIIKRLEGARKETLQPSPTNQQPLYVIQRPEAPPKGRLDALTIGSAAIAVSGLAVGTIFAIKALGDRPKSGFVTGRDGTYADLQEQADTAHREAIVADVGFGVGVAFTVLTAVLYFTRPKIVSVEAPATARVRVAGPSGSLISGSF
jgi:tetratricopeptide (TPR) repeat protein